MGRGLLHRFMHPPATAASRLLYGTGVGLLLGAGLAFQSGHTVQDQPPFLIVVLAVALLAIGAAWSLTNGVGPLAQRFSHETDEEMAKRVQTEVDDLQRVEDVNAKWAELEAKVLTRDLGEEE